MIRYITFIMMILLLASLAIAQGLGIGPQAGYFKSEDAEKGEWMFGGAMRIKLSPALGVEGAINYRQEKYFDGDLKVKSWPILVTGLIYPLPIIYGAIGAGWYNTTFDYSGSLENVIEDETTQDFGWHFGGGLELPLGGKTRLAGDIRYVFLNYDFKEIPGSRELKSDFYMIEIGLFFGL